MTNTLAAQYILQLRQAGYKSYLAGGCVRDHLLGRTPKDHDIATSATPDEIFQIFPQASLVGKAFGVVILPSEVGPPIEVATFRTEGAYSDQRHPDQVQFTTDPYLDSCRRDFTMNALYMDPVSEEILDFHNGVSHIKQGLIECVGKAAHRFEEDPLRMLRAFRFVSVLGFTTSMAIRSECDTYTGADLLNSVSKERIQQEISGLLMGAFPHEALKLLKNTHIELDIFPAKLFKMPHPQRHHPEGNVGKHTLKVVERASEQKNKTLPLMLAALLHDIGKISTLTFDEYGVPRYHGHDVESAAMTGKILRDLRYSTEIITLTTNLVAQHMRFRHVRTFRTAKLKRFLSQPHFDQHLALNYADTAASNKDFSDYEFCLEQLKNTPPEILNPAPLITGNDIMRYFCIPASPLIGVYLRRAMDIQLENPGCDKDTLLTLLEVDQF